MIGAAHRRPRVDRRRVAIAAACGLAAGLLTAAVAIPATTPTTVDQARDAAPLAESDTR